MAPGLTINRKLQFFAIRVRFGCCRCVLTLGLLLSLTLCGFSTINIPELPKEKKADKKKDLQLPRPPQPVPVVVQVARGGTVVIPLRIFGRQEQATRFLVRSEPVRGKILNLQPAEQEVWMLTYQHTSAMNEEITLQDHILFAAQNKNGTSSAAEIVINIVDNGPELAVPGPIEFGEVAAGIPSSRILTVANNGGGVLEGTVTADAPWTLEPAGFKLRRGEKAQLRLTLLPDVEREYQGRVRFSDSTLETPLHANAFAPFTFDPPALELEKSPDSLARSGTFALTNRTSVELTVEVEANARLAVPSKITLAPKATVTIPIALAADDEEGIDGSVRFGIGKIVRQMRIHAVGTKTVVEVPLLPKMTPPNATPTHKPKIVASVPSSSPTATPPEAPSVRAHSESVPDVDSTALMAAVSTVIGARTGLLPITGVAVLRTTADGTAEFGWAPVSLGDASYRIEIRRLSFGQDNKLVQRWVPVPDVLFTQTPERITGFVRGIPLGIRDTAHIVALTAQGELCAESPPFSFAMPMPFRVFTLRNGVLLILSLVVFGGLGARWLEKKRQV